MSKFYEALAHWWHIISPPEEYADEAAAFLELFEDVANAEAAHLLELGSGGGNNALHMKSAFASTTLVDLSPQMLAMSEGINPDCTHMPGDMRTLRLGKTFDAVFIHDAIDYMTSVEDLKQAFETAFVHCKAGGMALIVPDHVRETFEAYTDHGGADDGERSARYLEWSYDPDESDTTCITDYVFITRDSAGETEVIHDRHVLGLFATDVWMRLLAEVGFEAHFVEDEYERYIFVAHKP
jgi:trans-aconitate methyltransferase